MSDTSRTGTSFSYRQSHNLPGSQPSFYSVAPKVRMGFDMNRDPYIKKQLADRGKSEFQRREDAMGHTKRKDSDMIKRQQPKPALRPPRFLSVGPDRGAFNQQLAQDDRESRRQEFVAKRRADRQQGQQKSRVRSQFQKRRGY